MSVTAATIAGFIARACDPGRFFLGGGGTMRLAEFPAEELPWEIFRGHLLDAGQTRATRMLATWNVCFRWPEDVADQPLLSLMWDQAGNELHVVRRILVYGWETYESSPNTIESREAQVWKRELVGSIRLPSMTASNGAANADSCLNATSELAGWIERAVRGTSRLPITSLESPLPAFSLGRLAYFSCLNAGPSARPIHSPRQLVRQAFQPETTRAPFPDSLADQARLLEVMLRAAQRDDLPNLAREFLQLATTPADLIGVVCALFSGLALSPYTGMGARLVDCLQIWSAADMLGLERAVDLIGYMLRHLVRHLTAFDLVTFHNRGANFPDALFLDDLLKALLRHAESSPELFAGDQGRLRRRALRQGWLLRKMYEGHPVPAVPTSPGENLRVLPPQFPRASEEELLYAAKRRQALFADDPLESLLTINTRPILAQSLADLDQPDELRELGMATFLDRPWGVLKPPGEVDRTPLLSYEAASGEIAIDRLRQLRRHELFADDSSCERLIAAVRASPSAGLPAAAFSAPDRPGAAALEDANRAADDFCFLRTTRGSLHDFLGHFNLESLSRTSPQLFDWLTGGRDVLLIRKSTATSPCLLALNSGLQQQAEIVAAGPDVTLHQFAELPSDGLLVHMPDGTTCALPLRRG